MRKKYLHLKKKIRLTFKNRKNLLFSNFYKGIFANIYMSHKKLGIIFDINTFKLFQMQKFITDVEYI